MSSRCTSALVAMSMPRVGSSTMSSAGWRPSHLASTTFCWFPPDSWDTGSMSRPYLRLSRTAQSAANARSAADRTRPPLRSRPSEASATFCCTDMSMTRPCCRRSSGTKPMPAAIAPVGEPAAQLLAAHQHPAGVVAVDAEHGPGHLAAAGPDQAGQRDDLARPDLERDVGEHAFPGQALDHAGRGRRAQRAARRRVPPPGGRPSRAPGHRRSARPARWSARAGRRASR